MSESRFDVVVIGGGPGGYVAAIRAAQLGLRAALVEREHLGGICSNWGCIPTKALLHAASMYRQMQHASSFGIRVEGLSFDLGQLVEASRKTASRMNNGVRYLLKKNKVTLFEGQGRLVSRNEIEINGPGKAPAVIGARHVILATGARPRDIPGLLVDGEQVWNYRHALVPKALPESLLVVGAGAIGMEFASFYSTLGCKVTVIEAQQRVLPMEDGDVSAFVRSAFEQQGVNICTGTTVGGVQKMADGLQVTLQRDGQPEQMNASHMLVSVGVTGNTEHLGLECTRLQLQNGYIETDAYGQTSEPGIYAVGDVAGPPWLAHKASHEAVICVENIVFPGHAQPLNKSKIPACTYCHPQVASIGLTEEQARQHDRQVRVGHFPFTGNGKATAMGDTGGFIKTVFDAQTGELLGAHLVGAEVTELVHGFAIATTLEATEVELVHTIFPHPTLSEAAHESVLMAFDRALHV